MEFSTIHLFANVTALLYSLVTLTAAQTPTALLFQSGHSGPYAESATATLVCKVTDYDTNVYMVAISRTRSSITTTLLYDDQVVESAPANVGYLGSFPQSDSTWKIIQLEAMTPIDAGLFTCNVIQRISLSVIATHSIEVQVQFVPVPQCSLSTSASPVTTNTYRVGDVLNLVCASELGVPTANLIWGVAANGPTLPESNPTTDLITDTIYLQIAVTMTLAHDGVSYQCFASSSAGSIQSCGLGPYAVVTAFPLDTTTLTPSTIATTTNELTRRVTMGRHSNQPSTRQSDRSTAVLSTSNSSPQTSGLNGSAVAGICIIFIILLVAVVVLVFFVRTGRLNMLMTLIPSRKKDHGQGQAQTALNANKEEKKASAYEEHAYYNAAQDSATVQHVKADGVLYAVVDKNRSKSQGHLTEIGNGKVPNNNHENVRTQSNGKDENKRPSEPVLYANLNESSAGSDSPRREKSTTVIAVPCSEDISQTDADSEQSSYVPTLTVPCSDEGGDDNNLYASVNTKVNKKMDDTSVASHESVDEAESPSKDLNVEGLLYADLELIRPGSKRDTIISTDEATIYADIGSMQHASEA